MSTPATPTRSRFHSPSGCSSLSRKHRLAGSGVAVGVIALAALLLASRADDPEVGHPVSGVAALINASAPGADIFNAQFCGGVLVAPDTVLTAGHCVRSRSAASIHVVIGADNLCRDRPIDGQRIAVAAIELHRRYDQRTAVNDLARLRLVSPANDAPRRVASWPAGTAGATAVGWGQASVGGLPTCRLVRMPLVVHQPADCERGVPSSQHHRFEPDTMLCASPATRGGRDTCSGDSGGPVFVGSDLDSSVVIGVTSWGFGCADGVPGVYARADAWQGRDPAEP